MSWQTSMFSDKLSYLDIEGAEYSLDLL